MSEMRSFKTTSGDVVAVNIAQIVSVEPWSRETCLIITTGLRSDGKAVSYEIAASFDAVLERLP